MLHLVIALGLVAPAAFQSGDKTIMTALLGNPVMRFLGKISYGVFLWQFVIINRRRRADSVGPCDRRGAAPGQGVMTRSAGFRVV